MLAVGKPWRFLGILGYTVCWWGLDMILDFDFKIVQLIWLIFSAGLFRGLFTSRDISSLPGWRLIPFSYDLMLAGQLTSGFLPYLKREINLARNVLMLRKSEVVSRADQLHLLIMALLVKIYNRKLQLKYSLLSRGYGNSITPSVWIQPIKLTKADILPACLILGLISQQWLI
jgi:hypothetical protein